MKIHQHEFAIESTNIYVEILEMEKSVFIHCSTDEQGVLGHLSVAIPTKYEDQCSSSTILNPQTDNTTELIAKRLAKRFKIQVFVSIHLDKLLHPLLEKQLVLYLKSLTFHETLELNAAHEIPLH